MKTPPDEQVETRVITEVAALDEIRSEWDDLFASSPTASTPLDFVWLRTWWDVMKPILRDADLRIVTVRRSSRLIGAIPLYVHRGRGGNLGVRRLAFVATGEPEDEGVASEYLDMLHRPGEEAHCANAIWQAIGTMAWDHLDLVDLSEKTPLLATGTAPANARSVSRENCFIADLTDGLEAYLQRLSSNGRQNARRLMRQGEEAGVRFELVDELQAESAFVDLVRLHQDRWTSVGDPGVFATPLFSEFHRSLVRQWLPAGRAILARLWLDSEPVAVLYGFVTRQRFDYYQAGMVMDTGGRLRSPGILAHLLLMRALHERGVTEYDFLKGSYSYKDRLSTHSNKLVSIRIRRPTLRTAFDSTARRARRLLQVVVRFLSRVRETQPPNRD